MILITGLSRSEHHSCYTLMKKQEFFSGFHRFLVDLGFDESRSDVSTFGRPLDDDGEPDMSKEEDITIYIDKRAFFENKEYVIDVVFGKDRIFVIIASYRDKQVEIVKNMGKFCTFGSQEKLSSGHAVDGKSRYSVVPSIHKDRRHRPSRAMLHDSKCRCAQCLLDAGLKTHAPMNLITP
jgi:hypothetical protein